MIKFFFVNLINKFDNFLIKIWFLLHLLSGRDKYLICSFPKSGRTWIRFILANYFNEVYGFGCKINLHNVYNFTPSLNNRRAIFKSPRIFKGSMNPNVFSSHMQYNEKLVQKSKVILVLRSVPDTIVSYYFHNSKHHSKFTGDIKDFIRDDEQCLKKIVEYFNSWSPVAAKDYCLVITYEALSVDALSNMAKFIEFLNLNVDKRALENAIDSSSFDSMKEVEIRRGIAGHDYDKSQKDARRVRRGKVNGYVDYLDSDDIEFINNYLNNHLSKESLKMLKDNGIKV